MAPGTGNWGKEGGRKNINTGPIRRSYCSVFCGEMNKEREAGAKKERRSLTFHSPEMLVVGQPVVVPLLP